MSSGVMPPFWQAMVLRLLRLAVQVAYKSSFCVADDLEKLLHVAIYEELTAQGLSGNKMSLVLGCSPRKVRGFAQTSRLLHQEIGEASSLRRVLQALKTGPLSQRQLDRLIKQENEFDPRSLLLKILVSQGAIVITGTPPVYTLSPNWSEREAARWEEPLDHLEQVSDIALKIVHTLLTQPMTLDQLLELPSLRVISAPLVTEALDLLLREEFLACRSVGAHSTAKYSVTRKTLLLVPDDLSIRLRVGLLDLLDKLGMFLGVVLDRVPLPYFGQRNVLFTVRPEALKRFVDDHHTWTLARLAEMEKEAEGSEDKRLFLIAWMISPTPGTGSTLKSEDPDNSAN